MNKLTKEQAVILTAYTGIFMCNFDDLHQYAEKVLDRSVFTHEFASKEFMLNLKNASTPDFFSIIQ